MQKQRCNICGSCEFHSFGGRENAQCVTCGSLERTRFFWMHLDQLIKPSHRVLHFAPEKGIFHKLRERLNPGDYTAADLNPDQYPWSDQIDFIDLLDLTDLPSKHFDFVLHSHVLEHIPCNLAAPLFHIHRSLKETGRHMFIIPVVRGSFYDCAYGGIPQDEREARFGRHDHVRQFGLKDLDLSLGTLIKLPWDYDALDQFSAKQLTEIGLAKTYWQGLSMNSVINLGRYDMKLLPRNVS